MTEIEKMAVISSYMSSNTAKISDKEVFRLGGCNDYSWGKTIQQYMVLHVVGCSDSELTPDQKDCLLNNALDNGKL